MADIPTIYFSIIDTSAFDMITYNDLEELFEGDEDIPRSNINQTYVTSKNNDGDYLIYIFDIPKSVKKRLSPRIKWRLRKYWKSDLNIMAHLDMTLRALMIFEDFDEAILMVPCQNPDYKPIFDTVILRIFDIIEERYDPETGEGIIRVKAKFDKDDINIKEIISIGGEDDE